MTWLIALVVGFLAVRALVLAAPTVLVHPVLERQNYRARKLPTAMGLFVVVAVVLVEGGRAALGALDLGDPGIDGPRVLVLVAVTGFGFLGLVDDLLGTGDDRGFRGHFRALSQGRVTTGFVKLAGGGALAIVLATSAHAETGLQPFVDAALIALAANLGNLLDRAPGRTTKFALLAYIPIALVCGTSVTGTAIAVVAGCAAGLLPGDLRERHMLGDAGANLVGAALGLAIVLEASTGARLSVATALFVANLLSEFVSYSRVIERVAPLRAFDRLGREADA